MDFSVSLQIASRSSCLGRLQNYAENYWSWGGKKIEVLTLDGKDLAVRILSDSSFSIWEKGSFLLILPPLFLFFMKVSSRLSYRIDQFINEEYERIQANEALRSWTAKKNVVCLTSSRTQVANERFEQGVFIRLKEDMKTGKFKAQENSFLFLLRTQKINSLILSYCKNSEIVKLETTCKISWDAVSPILENLICMRKDLRKLNETRTCSSEFFEVSPLSIQRYFVELFDLEPWLIGRDLWMRNCQELIALYQSRNTSSPSEQFFALCKHIQIAFLALKKSKKREFSLQQVAPLFREILYAWHSQPPWVKYKAFQEAFSKAAVKDSLIKHLVNSGLALDYLSNHGIERKKLFIGDRCFVELDVMIINSEEWFGRTDSPAVPELIQDVIIKAIKQKYSKQLRPCLIRIEYNPHLPPLPDNFTKPFILQLLKSNINILVVGGGNVDLIHQRYASTEADFDKLNDKAKLALFPSQAAEFRAFS